MFENAKPLKNSTDYNLPIFKFPKGKRYQIICPFQPLDPLLFMEYFEEAIELSERIGRLKEEIFRSISWELHKEI